MIAVDTSAIMAILLGEPNADQVMQCLANNELCMSAGTLSELLIVTATRGLDDEAGDLVKSVGMEIVIVDGRTANAVQTAYKEWGKGRHKAGLNFGDCFAYSLAKDRNIPLLFMGDDFSQTDLDAAM